MTTAPPPSRALRIWAVVCSVMVVGLMASALLGPSGIQQHESLRNRLTEVQALRQQALKENQKLSRQAKALRHDRAYIESAIREELGWVRKDELIFKF